MTEGQWISLEDLKSGRESFIKKSMFERHPFLPQLGQSFCKLAFPPNETPGMAIYLHPGFSIIFPGRPLRAKENSKTDAQGPNQHHFPICFNVFWNWPRAKQEGLVLACHLKTPDLHTDHDPQCSFTFQLSYDTLIPFHPWMSKWYSTFL